MDIFLKNDLKRLNFLKSYEKVVESVKAICPKHDSKAWVILFGSVLRGNWTGDSDIDILIIVHSPDAKGRITVNIWRTIDAPVEIHFCSEDMFKNWYMRFMDVYREV